MELANYHLNFTHRELADMLVFYYISRNKIPEFKKLYKDIYSDATDNEMLRIEFFVRLALGLPDNTPVRY